MRLLTWNCARGRIDAKAPRLDPLAADIIVLQECARPDATSDRCLWFGDNPLQGIAILVREDFSISALPARADVPPYTIPIIVRGPHGAFLILAVWSKKARRHPYIEGVVEAIDTYRDLIEAMPTVVIGDLNSNAIWDRQHPVTHNHSALVARLAGLGMTSAYHEYFREPHGAESMHTFYFRKKAEKPFHIDYCFVPSTWLLGLKHVGIGNYAEWHDVSDHRPLWVDIDDAVIAASEPGAMPLEVLRALYLALGAIEELPGERTMLGRCCTFEAFIANGPACAAFLRRDAGDEGRPDLAALLLTAFPFDPPEFYDWPIDRRHQRRR